MDERKSDSTHSPSLADGTDRQHKKKRTNPCKGCYFYGGKTEYVTCCNYFLITGKRRPCEIGENCTVWIDGKQNRRKAMTVINFPQK